MPSSKTLIVQRSMYSASCDLRLHLEGQAWSEARGVPTKRGQQTSPLTIKQGRLAQDMHGIP
jgi:hypothetical protein